MRRTIASGTTVLVDGRYRAIVREAFPEGSTSFRFSHYKVDMVDGDKNVAVAMSRIARFDRQQNGGASS